MNTITTSVLPPQITSVFDRHLLSRHYPRFNAKELLKLAQWLQKRIDSAEFQKFPNTKNKIFFKIEKFMELYEETKIKEREAEAKAFIKASWPFYRPRLPNKNDQSVFNRLDDRRKTSQRMLRKNNKISKV